MNNGMTFGMEGPQITGWWVNPTTGDKFNAVDTFFEDNQLLIKTADGRLLNFNQIQNYVQTKAEDANKIAANAKSKSQSSSDVPAEVLNELEGTDPPEGLLIPDDNIFGMGGQKSTPLGNMNGAGMPTPVAESSEMSIIQRALKNKTKPVVTGLIDWKDFPKKEIEMLQDMMDVPFETIVDYYVNSVNVNEIVNNIKTDLTNYIQVLLGKKKLTTNAPATVEPSVSSVGEKETTPKKTSKKK